MYVEAIITHKWIVYCIYHIILVVRHLCQHNHGSQIRTRSTHVLSTTMVNGCRGWDNLWALRNSLDDMHSILQFAPWLPIISVAARVGNQSPFNVSSEMYFFRMESACVCVCGVKCCNFQDFKNINAMFGLGWTIFSTSTGAFCPAFKSCPHAKRWISLQSIKLMHLRLNRLAWERSRTCGIQGLAMGQGLSFATK